MLTMQRSQGDCRLFNCVGDKFHIVPLKKGSIPETKIQVIDEECYRKVVSLLEKKCFYTYKLKSSKGLVVIMKGIDYDIPLIQIKEALQTAGFKIQNIKNRNKVPQPLFKMELTPKDSKCAKNKSNPIYELRYLLHRKITVEEPRSQKNIIQCTNCQEFKHTKAYCTLRSVCVICGDLHPTSECPFKN